LVILVTGCVRDPAPAACPDVAVGDLALTEIRGPQDQDALGTWVELYNTTTHPIDLDGLKIRFRKKDGSTETDVLVRRSVEIAAAGYVTLGLVGDAMRPDYIDYGMSGDFHTSFLAAAVVDVESCDVRIDRATYDVLPAMGTYSLGTTPPSADNNDLPTNWCTDATNLAGTYPGTPQQANLPCP
jgi:hypothetical protein